MHRPALCRAFIFGGGGHFAVQYLEIPRTAFSIRRAFRNNDDGGSCGADCGSDAVCTYSGAFSDAALRCTLVHGGILCGKDIRKTRKGAWHPHWHYLRHSHVCGTDECMLRLGCCDFLTNPNTLHGDFTMCRIGRHSWCEHQNYQTTLLKNP